jgi:hypothetical protein
MTKKIEPQKVRVTATVTFIVETTNNEDIANALEYWGDNLGYAIEGLEPHFVLQHYLNDICKIEPIEHPDGLPF